MPTTYTATTDTPDGPFTLISTDDAVLASGWTSDVGDLLTLIHPSLRPITEPTSDPAASVMLQTALGAVDSYYDDDVAAPRSVPVLQKSGPFRQHGWEVLRGVQPGRPLTYAEFAAAAGHPAAVRAAAGVCAHNAAALFVPCHRVLRTDGSLGGFRYGTAIKSRLLQRERTLA